MTEDINKLNKQSDDELVARLQVVLADQKTRSATTSGKVGFKLNKDALTLAVLVVLVVISGVQTAKLSSLQAAGTGSVVAPAVSNSNGSSGGSALPASLQNLPSQVGGC